MTIEKKLLAIMEGKTDLVEYHMAGTVNGKKFKANCDDVYNADDILAQNPHLSANEAKAIHDHTETDNFIDGYSGTEGLHGGHLVKITSNGGYFGDKTEMQNKIAKLSEGKDEKKDGATDGSDAEGKADQVVDEPAVTIENPLDPALAGSDADDQNPGSEDDEEKIEESATRDHVIEKATEFFNKKHNANFNTKQIHDYLYNPNSRGEAAVLDFVNKKPELEDANVSGEMHKHFGMSRSKFQNLLDFNESLNDGSYSASGETGGDSIQHGDWTITLHAKDGNNGASIVARHKDGGAKLNVFSGSSAHADSFFNHPSHLKKTVDILSGKVQESVEDLSEEFKAQAKALFEAKLSEEVEHSVNEKTAKFEEKYTLKLEESIQEFETDLIEKIDGYFDVLSEQWMRDNELALEAGTRSSLTESFMESIKKVFDAHYIDFPVEKIDIVESMEKTQDELKDEIVQLKLALDEKAQMLEDTKREIILETATKGMTDIDAIKLKALVEELGPTSNDELSKRITSLKESMFTGGKKIEIDQSKLNLSSKPLLEEAELKKPSTTRVSKYADHIRKSTTTRK